MHRLNLIWCSGAEIKNILVQLCRDLKKHLVQRFRDLKKRHLVQRCRNKKQFAVTHVGKANRCNAYRKSKSLYC